jgi:hypothetical protein
MLLLRIQKKNLYISTRQVEKYSGLITITNQFRKFSHLNAKRTLQFAVSIECIFIRTRIKSSYI